MTSPSQDEATPEPEATDPPPPTYRKADVPVLTATASAEDALAAIVLSGVTQLRGNEACVLARSDEEGIHQMRVAIRRLRSSLSLFGDFLPPEQVNYLGGELRWLIGELGPARDWDVFLAETLAKVLAQVKNEAALEDLRARAKKKQDDAYRRAHAALGSQRYLGMVMLLGAWAEGRRWHDPAAAAPAVPGGLQNSAEAVAHALLDKRYRRVRQVGRRFTSLDPAGRHKLRIQIKKLRYATEFFGSLYPKERLSVFLSDAKLLQDGLGVSNDIDVARRLVHEVIRGQHGKERARLSFAAGLVIGWHGHVADNREQTLRLMWRRFIRRRPFWVSPPETEVAGHTPTSAAAPADSPRQGPYSGRTRAGGGGASVHRRRRPIVVSS